MNVTGVPDRLPRGQHARRGVRSPVRAGPPPAHADGVRHELVARGLARSREGRGGGPAPPCGHVPGGGHSRRRRGRHDRGHRHRRACGPALASRSVRDDQPPRHRAGPVARGGVCVRPRAGGPAPAGRARFLRTPVRVPARSLRGAGRDRHAHPEPAGRHERSERRGRRAASRGVPSRRRGSRGARHRDRRGREGVRRRRRHPLLRSEHRGEDPGSDRAIHPRRPRSARRDRPVSQAGRRSPRRARAGRRPRAGPRLRPDRRLAQGLHGVSGDRDRDLPRVGRHAAAEPAGRRRPRQVARVHRADAPGAGRCSPSASWTASSPTRTSTRRSARSSRPRARRAWPARGRSRSVPGDRGLLRGARRGRAARGPRRCQGERRPRAGD